MVLWQPPNRTSRRRPRTRGVLARRRSPYAEAADVVAGLVRARVQCLCFVSARKLTEVIVRDVKAQLVRAGQQELALRVDSYRAGYNVGGETRLGTSARRGEVSALVCTSALEMGIDVGALDATVHVGVPETAAAMWQQAGRAGRRSGASLAVVVACERPLDAFYLSKPEDLFSQATGGGGGGPGERLHLGTAPTVRGVRDSARPSRGRETLRRRRGGIGVSAVHGFEADERGGEGGGHRRTRRGVSRRPSTIVRAHAGRPIRGRRFRLESRRGAVEQRRADDVPQPAPKTFNRWRARCTTT